MKFPGNWKTWLAGVAIVLVAGSAAAFLVSSQREVTTTSRDALRSYRLGLENEEKLYHREAMTAYAEALSRDPYFVMATVRLANLMWEREPARAESLVRKISQCREGLTKREKLSLEIFEARFIKKDRDLVRKAVDRYIEEFPNDPDGYRERALLLRKSGDIAKAMADFEILISRNPNNALAYNFLGYYAMEQGDYARAEDYFTRYRFLAPEQANPYDSLAELLCQVGRYDEAEENLKKALAIKGDFPPLVGHLGVVAMGRGDYAAAVAHYERAAEVMDTPLAQFELTFAAIGARIAGGDLTAAMQRLDTLSTRLPEVGEKYRPRIDFGMKTMRASILARQGQYPAGLEILAELGRWRDLPKHDQEALALIRQFIEARQALQRHEPEPARALVKKLGEPGAPLSLNASGYFPSHKVLRVDLASQFLDAGYPDDAQALLATVTAIDPNFKAAVDLEKKLQAEAQTARAPSRPRNG
ncbi:MAG: Beta-barrel assembly-enhancing protease [Thermoanaerobaculia bacterium]|nr:Beta-barrel assembly-enhancing protease [Thermoanaerobaculia bacterium]